MLHSRQVLSFLLDPLRLRPKAPWLCASGLLGLVAFSPVFSEESASEVPSASPPVSASISRLRSGGLLSVPSGEVVAHGQYRFVGSLQYFSASEFHLNDSGNTDTAVTRQFNYGTEVLFGLENRAEIGLHYGQELAMSFKALLIEEDAIWPNIVFGIRSLFGSSEADLYGVTDHDIVRSLRGESFLMAAKTFAINTRLHAGASMLNGANKSLVSMNFGLEQNLGAGAFLGYELYERFSDFHQNVSLTWRFGPIFAMHLGLTEFQSWIRQRGEWGFFLAPAHAQKTGYNAPGLRFALQVNGFMPRIPQKTLSERMADLEERDREREQKLQRLQGQIVKLRLEQTTRPAPSATPAAAASSPSAAPDPRSIVAAWLDSLNQGMNGPKTDPQRLSALLARTADLPPLAKPYFAGIALDTGRSVTLRLAAIMAMGHTRDSALVAPLKLVCADADSRLRREALTALGRIGHPSALDVAKRLMNDADAAVSLTAEEVVSSLAPKANPKAPSKAAGEAPTDKAQAEH